MKVLRSTVIAGLAVFAAACGDKVTVAGPASSSTTPTVVSVTVTPNNATMSIGNTINLTAVVTVTNGASQAVSWSSGDATKASVSTSGQVTAVAATPGVAICATSTADATQKGCATIVVQPGSTIIPATVSIQSITVNGNINTSVNPGAVAGVIDVRANVAPGTQTVQKIVVAFGATHVDSQTFSAAQSAALRFAQDNAADQSAFPPVLFSINTAKFNATTGVPLFVNGNYNVSVILYVAGNTAAQSTATYQTPLTFANADGWVATVTTSGTTANALNAAGFRYDRGAIAVTALPVSYSGTAVAAANANFGSAGCDASGGGTRTLALTAPAAGSSSWTGTFSQTAAAGVGQYEFNGCVANNAIGEIVTLTATNGAGDALFTAAAPINANAVVGIRLDNRPPGGVLAVATASVYPQFCANANNRGNGWINAAVTISGTSNACPAGTGTSNQWITDGTADAGVGGTKRFIRMGTAGTGLTVDGALAATASATLTTPAPTANGNSMCAIITAQDALGNETPLPAAAAACGVAPAGPGSAAQNPATKVANSLLFGVDIAAPTIGFSGGMAAGSSGTNGKTGASVGGEFQVAVSDTGAIGNSGMLAGSPVIGTVTIRTAAAGLTAAALCPVGTVSGGVCTASNAGFAAAVYPLVATAAITAQTVIGYYTYTGTAIDAAGNTSAAVTRTVAYNPVATNLPTVTTSLFSTPLNGPSATFTATGASGNTTVNGPTTFFDLWNVGYNLTYSAGAAGPLLYPTTTINSFNGATMVNANVPVTITINGFIRQLQAQTSACNAALAVGATGLPNGLNETVKDQVGNTSAVAATAIAPAQVTAGVSYLGAAAPQQTFSFIASNGVTEQPTAGGCPLAVGANATKKVSGGGTSPDAASITLTADVWGPTATYNAPFAQVNFYVLVGANLELIGTTTTYSLTDDGSANGRKYSYSFAWTPGSKSPISLTAWAALSSAACPAPPTATSIYAIGVSAAGDGLVAPVNNNVCISTAP